MTDMLPRGIAALAGNRPWHRDRIGMSGAEIRIYPDMVLKTENICLETEREYALLTWLRGKLPVPEVLARETVDGRSYLLMSRLPGVMACDPTYLRNPEALIRLMGQALRMLWRVDTAGCPAVSNLDVRLSQARLRVEQGRVDLSSAEPGTFGPGGFQGPEALLMWLEENRPVEQLRFTHGDLCLPNLFLQGEEISGFLDLGHGGLADPWQDIALLFRSLRHNADGTYDGACYPGFDEESIFRGLGVLPDHEKLRYYILLDELF